MSDKKKVLIGVFSPYLVWGYVRLIPAEVVPWGPWPLGCGPYSVEDKITGRVVEGSIIMRNEAFALAKKLRVARLEREKMKGSSGLDGEDGGE